MRHEILAGEEAEVFLGDVRIGAKGRAGELAADAAVTGGEGEDLVDLEGDAAVHGAAIRGWNDVITLLAGYGEKLDVADKDGMTPIDYALARYPLTYLESKPVPHDSTAALLKSLGATKETPNPPAWPPVGVPQSTAQVPQLTY